MKPALLLLPFLLAACGQPADRLTDEEALIDAPDLPVIVPAEATGRAAALPAAASTELLYRAARADPPWTLLVRGHGMFFQARGGDLRIAEATPAGFRPEPGTYRSGRLSVTIAPGPCRDMASGRSWRDTVTVVAAGERMRGCGGDTVAADPIAGTEWTVARINGRPTGGGSSYRLTFADGRVRGQFGCNSLEGAFSSAGERLSVRDVIVTQMLCGQPADQFEREGLQVLRGTVRVERGAGRMQLASEAGSIELTA